MNDLPSKCLTPQELEDLWHIKPDKVRTFLNSGQCVTPPKVAERWRVKPEKVIAFIKSGELKAIDISMNHGMGRPRYRIPLVAIAEFEKRRAVQPPPKRICSQKKKVDVIKFF